MSKKFFLILFFLLLVSFYICLVTLNSSAPLQAQMLNTPTSELQSESQSASTPAEASNPAATEDPSSLLKQAPQESETLTVHPAGSSLSNSIKEAPPKPVSAVKLREDGYPIKVSDKAVLYVYAKMGPFTPEQRARYINERLNSILYDETITTDSLTVKDFGGTSNIYIGNKSLITLGNDDVVDDPERGEISRHDLAWEYVEILKLAIDHARYKKWVEREELRQKKALELQQQERRKNTIGIIVAIIGFIIWILFIIFSKRVMLSIYKRIEILKEKKIRSIKVEKAEILSADKICNTLKLIVRVLRVLLILVLANFYVFVVIYSFPVTSTIAHHLTEYFFNLAREQGIKFIEYIPKLLLIIFTLVACRYALWLSKYIFDNIGQETINIPGFYSEWAEPTNKIVKFFIIAATITIIYPNLPGYDSDAFKGLSVFFGVVLSLGSTTFVANVIAGLVLTYTRSFKLNDVVQIENSLGYVIEKNILVTRIRTLKNEDVSIPNSMVLSKPVINYSANAADMGLILCTSITIGYDVPWRDVHSCLKKAALCVEEIEKDPEPFIHQVALGDYSVEYSLLFYTKIANRMGGIRSKLHEQIQDKFNEAGIEIMSPAYHAVRDGNQTTIPADYLPADYRTPAFRIDAVPYKK